MSSPRLTVLVADDSATDRLLISGLLRQWGYDVLEAADGPEAWRIASTESVDLVVSDWNMPGFDGPELCRRIRQDRNGRYTYVVLLTVRDDRDSFVAGMEAGADEFLSKPIDAIALQLRLRSGSRVVQLERQIAERSHRLADALERIEGDLRSAAETQRSLLPAPATLQGTRWSWLYRPSSLLAGDMVGYGVLDEEHVAFYQVDVAGHGVASALMSFSLCHLLTTRSTDGSVVKRRLAEPPFYEIVHPADVVAELNRRFFDGERPATYFTMIYGVLDTVRRRVELVQAGHPAPIVITADGRWTVPGVPGFPVGLIRGADYHATAIELDPGDRLILTTDGAADTQGTDGVPFGDERLLELLRSTASLPADQALAEVERSLFAWSGTADPEDDISLLTVDILSGS